MLIPIEQKRQLIQTYGVNIPSRFEMRFQLPLGAQSNELFFSMLGDNIARSTLRLSLACESTDIPGRLFQSTEHKIYSVDRKMPFGVMMEDVSMTFRCSEDLFERKFIEAWHTLIQDPLTKDMGYYNDYVTDIDIFSYDKRFNTVVHAIRLYEAYPFSLFPLVADNASSEYQKQTVGFKYKEWKSLGIVGEVSTIFEERVNSFPNFESIIRNVFPSNII